MSASYPRAIKAFLTRHDYTDDVMAAHVNDLQDEVSALESIIGINPQLPNASIAERLSSLETGRTRTVFYTARHQAIYNVPVQPLTTENLVAMDPPPSGYDPLGLYNGVGFTLKKTGFYYLGGNMRWEVNSSVGTRRTTINASAPTMWGGHLGVVDLDGPSSTIRYAMVPYFGVLTAGTAISLNVAHSCGTKQPTVYGSLGGFLVREF